MKLERFLKDAQLTDGQFAELLGVDASMVNRLKSGQRKASLVLVLAIERVTEGRVTAADLPVATKTRRALSAMRLGAANGAAA